jgi:hypothetical protein
MTQKRHPVHSWEKILGDAFVGNRDVRCDTNFLAIDVADTVCLALMGGTNL